jgi:hypothetical protein
VIKAGDKQGPCGKSGGSYQDNFHVNLNRTSSLQEGGCVEKVYALLVV